MRISKLDEMTSAGRVDYYPKGKAYYQVSYEKDGETVTTTREYVNQAKLIYDEYNRKNLDGTRYPNLRLEEVAPDGTVTVLRGGEGMNENAGPDTRDSGTDWGIGKYISLCKYYLSYIDHKWDEPALDMLKKDMPRIKGMRTGTKFYPVLQVIGDNASLRNDVVECLEANGFTKDDYYVFDKDIDADEFDSAVRHLRRTHKFLVFDNVRITGGNAKETIDKWFALDHRSVTVPNASPVAAPDPIFIFICNPKRNNLLKLKDCVEIECGGETRHPRFGRFDESTVGAGNGNMQVRVTYRVQSYIDGRNLDDIKSKFENMRLPNNMGFVELVSVEDADTYEDLIDDWNGL